MLLSNETDGLFCDILFFYIQGWDFYTFVAQCRVQFDPLSKDSKANFWSNVKFVTWTLDLNLAKGYSI